MNWRVKREAQQPSLDRFGLLSGVVVDDDVHVQVGGDAVVDQIQEPPKLLGAMPWRHVGDHVAGGDIQRGVQVGGAMPAVVVGTPLGVPGIQR